MSEHAQKPPPPDFWPEARARLDQLVRRLDLVERRVGARERALQEAREALLPVVDAGRAQGADEARVEDLEGRVTRLERKGFGTAPGQIGLAFARFEPSEVEAGGEVRLEVGVEGLNVGDVVRFEIERIASDDGTARMPPVAVTCVDPAAPGLGFTWRVPSVAPGRIANYRFTVSARDVQTDSIVLIVRG